MVWVSESRSCFLLYPNTGTFFGPKELAQLLLVCEGVDCRVLTDTMASGTQGGKGQKRELWAENSTVFISS